MNYPKRSQYRYAKCRYRVQNWPDYEAGLRRRGDLTVWLSDAALNAWRAPASGKPGGQRTYSGLAIEAALTIRMVFHLPLRQTEGCLRSLAELLDLDLPIPDHTTLSRRLQKHGNLRCRRLGADEPIHLFIDSAGLRIHVGHLRRPPKRGVWRKLHLAVNADTGEILAEDLTNRHTADCVRVPKLLEQIDGPLASGRPGRGRETGTSGRSESSGGGKGTPPQATVGEAWWRRPYSGTRPSSVRG